MSRVYDSWERLVAAVLRREELWQLCHQDSREPSVNSVSSDFSSSWNSPPLSEDLTFSRNSEVSSGATRILVSWEKQYKRGLYITLIALSDGTRFVKRVRFSRMGSEEQHKAVIWWFKNREKIYKRYNAWGGNAHIRRPSVVVFSSSPLIDHQEFLGKPPSNWIRDKEQIVEAVVVGSGPEAENPTKTEKDENEKETAADSAPGNLNPCSDDGHVSVESEEPKSRGNEEKLIEAVEKSIKASDLSETEEMILQELKQLVQQGLNRHEFSTSSPKEGERRVPREEANETKEEEEEPARVEAQSIDSITKSTIDTNVKTALGRDPTGANSVPKKEMPQEGKLPVGATAPQEVFIWGVKLLEDERTDAVLLKFLRAQGLNVKDAFTMIKNTTKWRNEFRIDELVEEDLGSEELDRVIFMHGYSKEGHPVCYSVYGEFQNENLYQKTFSDEEKRQKFLRWRIQFLEKRIRKLDFRPGGVSTIFQVNDLKNYPGPNTLELRQASNQAFQLLQDNYPEFVAKQVFINAPMRYVAFHRILSPFLTPRTRSIFAFAGPSTSMATLFKYISAEQIPPQYRGLSKDDVFGAADSVTEIVVKPSAKHIEEFPVTQACLVRWEVRVVGWELSYGAEFVPSAEYRYVAIIEKTRRIGSKQEQVISGSYQVSEPGKLVLTFVH